MRALGRREHLGRGLIGRTRVGSDVDTDFRVARQQGVQPLLEGGNGRDGLTIPEDGPVEVDIE